ncbi:peptidoglycan D,D-transpeptidase FtsI family protein [Paenibacillus sp. NPDC056579]|uniref:peptidoglycan D,D-transpeptidase FtsI family protein n=1 Tax=Paenibacillus sp. NPDC056579 TaxID=3345871 RepID=UPI00369618B4
MKGRMALKKHRLFYILMIIILALAGLNARLFWIQVAASGDWTEHGVDLVQNSVIQRAQGIVLDSGRGDFYDRDGIPLTGKEQTVLVVFPVHASSPEQTRMDDTNIARTLQVPVEQWRAFSTGLKEPQIWTTGDKPVNINEAQAKQIEALRLPQLAVTKLKQHYGDTVLASQVIGYIGQNPERITRQFTDQFHRGELQLTSKIGGAGLEKTLEPWLQGIGPESLSLFTDGRKRPLPGLDARWMSPHNGYYPLKVITTLDASIQSKVEQAMRKLQVKEGAVVVTDASNGDVIAMASRPDFHPEHVDLLHGTWSNRALKAAAPGSIFKTVTAAAALEEHVTEPGEMFRCDGELGKYGLTCWNKQGHGLISLEEAYAESCNIVFARLAERLDGAKLQEYAHKLGLGTQIGWTGPFLQEEQWTTWDAEEKGQVFAASTPQQDGGVKAQTSIGQRDVLVTPLQAANMVVTLLHGGKVASPRIVSEMRFRNDRLMEKLEAKSLDGLPSGISKATSGLLLEWMTDVVQYGTGAALQSADWKVAGKSGTAQVGAKSGEERVNQWFIGYGPVAEPRYAVAVLVQNVPDGTKNTSIPLFREVMDVLAQAEQSGRKAQ